MNKVLPTLASLVVLCQLLINHSQAAMTTWQGPSPEGDWPITNYWDNGVPNAGLDAIIPAGRVRLIAPGAAASGLVVGNSAGAAHGELVITTWTNELGSTTGTLGTQIAYVGHSGPNVSGTVKVEGLGEWNNAGDLIVGYQSTGTSTLEIGYGGTVRSGRGIIGDFAGSTGLATVGLNPTTSYYSTWYNSTELRVGNAGVGILNVINEGHLFNTGSAFIGVHPTSTGTATVSGTGAAWTNDGDLIVGYQSTAANQLTVQAGGYVRSGRGFLGDFGPGAGPYSAAVGNVTVTGEHSGWDSGTELHVGNFGTGTLRIENGGTVWSGIGRVGVHSQAHGTVIVSGPSSKWLMDGDLYLGGSGQGSLFLSNGGIVSAPTNVSISIPGSVVGNGTIVTDILINSGLVHPDPPVSPGLAASTLYIEGDYWQGEFGKLQIDLDTGDYGRLSVDGDVTLDGTLEVTHIIGLPFWNPQVGDSFNILDWTGTLTGTFDSIVLPNLIGSRMWNTSQLYTQGVISVVAPNPLAGDFNIDGIVDAADYVLWRKNGGSQADFDTWKANFGNGPGSGAGGEMEASNQVPEPSAMTLFLLGAVGLFLSAARGKAFPSATNAMQE